MKQVGSVLVVGEKVLSVGACNFLDGVQLLRLYANPFPKGDERCVRIGLGESYDASDRSLEIPSFSKVDLIEHVEITRVNSARQQRRIIQRYPFGVAGIDGLERRPNLLDKRQTRADTPCRARLSSPPCSPDAQRTLSRAT